MNGRRPARVDESSGSEHLLISGRDERQPVTADSYTPQHLEHDDVAGPVDDERVDGGGEARRRGQQLDQLGQHAVDEVLERPAVGHHQRTQRPVRVSN